MHVFLACHRQGLGTLQRTLERIDRDLESKTACVSLDKECIEVILVMIAIIACGRQCAITFGIYVKVFMLIIRYFCYRSEKG